MWTALSLLPIACLALAAWRDLAARAIPDALPAVLALTALTLRARAGSGALLFSVVTGAILFLVLAALHGRGLLGGGDVKLASGVALGLAPGAVAGFLMATGLAGLALALLHLLLRALPTPRAAGGDGPLLRRVWRAERWRIARRGSLPYGVAIACGGAWAILLGPGG